MSNKLASHFFILCLCVSSFAVLAQAQDTSSTSSRLPPITLNIKEFRFTLKPGGSFTFPLPKVDSPIRIEISAPSTNGGVQTPSELMWALVNRDSGNSQITWIGSNSDGSALGSNSLSGGVLANIYGGSAPTTISSLVVANASAGTLSVKRSSTTTTISGRYVVRMYY